jgi:hypothetical protein
MITNKKGQSWNVIFRFFGKQDKSMRILIFGEKDY